MRVVSLSELKTFRRCRRKWWLGYHRGYDLRHGEPAGHRRLGTIVHKALETHYTGGDGIDAIRALRDSDITAVAARDDLDVERAADLQQDIVKQADLAILMFDGYRDWAAETGFDADLEIISLEEEVRVASPHPDYELVGKLDMRYRSRRTGFQAFLDFKTVGNLTDIPKMATLDEQKLMYGLLLRIATGEPIDGITWVMLRKVKRTAAAKPPFYATCDARFNDNELQAMWQRTYAILTEMRRLEELLEVAPEDEAPHVAYPTPTGDCSWDCDFLPACPLFDDGSRAVDLLEQFYSHRDPYERYGTVLAESKGRE